MKKTFKTLASGAIIISTLSSSCSFYGSDYMLDYNWKHAQNEQEYWAMVRKYNKRRTL